MQKNKSNSSPNIIVKLSEFLLRSLPFVAICLHLGHFILYHTLLRYREDPLHGFAISLLQYPFLWMAALLATYFTEEIISQSHLM